VRVSLIKGICSPNGGVGGNPVWRELGVQVNVPAGKFHVECVGVTGGRTSISSSSAQVFGGFSRNGC
jgi:hypothetical protein